MIKWMKKHFKSISKHLSSTPLEEQVTGGLGEALPPLKQESREACINAINVEQKQLTQTKDWTISSQWSPWKVSLTGVITLCDSCAEKMDSKYYAVNATEQRPREKTMQDESTGKGKPGLKDDKGKLRWDLLPWKALYGLVSVLTFGAQEYSPNGWRTVPNAKERYTAALFRHMYALNTGEKIDPKSGLRHIDHLLCNAAFLSELED